MGFLDSYKRLEKLCGDILGDDRCISAYIDEMIGAPQGKYYVSTWETDLKQLKHCRWIRNKIVHEPGCTEVNMCTDEDIVWLNEFYSRVLNTEDPLAVYERRMRKRAGTKKVCVPQGANTYQQSTWYAKKQKNGCGMTVLCVLGALALVIAVCYYVF